MQSHPVHDFLKTSQDTARLQREAAVLAHVAHPDVVEVSTFDAAERRLVLARVNGVSLVDAGAMDTVESISFFAAVADALAHVHQRGVAHGRVSAEHVLLRHSGRPVLCGFGDARPMPAGDDALAYDDVADLGHLMLASLPDSLQQLRQKASGDDVVAPTDQPARALITEVAGRAIAKELTAADVCRALSTPRPAAASKERRHRPRLRNFVSFGAVIAVGVAAFALAPQVNVGTGSSADAAPTTAAPATTIPGNVILGEDHYTVGDESDVIVTGKWSCGERLPVMLRRNDGTVWLFNSWPAPGDNTRGRPVGDFSGVEGIGVVTKGDCDSLSVTKSDGSVQVMELGEQ